MVLFRYGAFTGDNALATGWCCWSPRWALVPFAISQLFTFAFYALPDTRTPALVNIPVVALRVGGPDRALRRLLGRPSRRPA